MSHTSRSRKEGTESNAAKRTYNTMGQHPETSQLYERDLRNELPSKRNSSNDVDPQEVQPIDDENNQRVEAVRRDTYEDAELTRDREENSDINSSRYIDEQADQRGLSNAPMDDDLSFKNRNPDGPVDELGHS